MLINSFICKATKMEHTQPLNKTIVKKWDHDKRFLALIISCVYEMSSFDENIFEREKNYQLMC